MKENVSVYAEERQRKLLEIIKKRSKVTVKEMSQYFHISPVTIRSDLNTLSKTGKIIRTHGGAINVDETNSELPINIRKKKQKTIKTRLANKAAALVNDGEVIYIDASTTCSEMVPFLTERQEITVITNGLETAYNLALFTNVHIIVMGGVVRRESLSLVDVDIKAILPEVIISKAFVSSWGFSLEEGLTDVNHKEIELKKTLVNVSKSVIGLIDSTKWGKVSYGTFAHIDQIDIIICDKKAPFKMKEEILKKGIKVITTDSK